MTNKFVRWNYRVILHDEPEEGDNKDLWESWHAIHEVHYAEDGSITAWTVEPTYLAGETLAEIRSDVNRIALAFSRPVLIDSELVCEMATRGR